MKTVHEKYLLKRLHTLLGRLGVDDESRCDLLMFKYGVKSSADLNTKQLVELCDMLEADLNPQKRELDKNRKRVIAAIGGWLQKLGRENNLPHIKAIACRAAGVRSFNEISLERLRSLYSAFTNKQRDMEFVSTLTKMEVDVFAYLN